jgi:hypothetical protein
MGKIGSKHGPDQIRRLEHLDASESKKVTDAVLVPGSVITSDSSSAAVLVGIGNLVRIRVTAPTYVAFGPTSTISAVSITTSPAIELYTAGTYLIAASDQFMRTSANPARIELIQA